MHMVIKHSDLLRNIFEARRYGMNVDPKHLAYEAKHSFAILLGFVGDADTNCNRILLKWPDAMDALLSEDEDKFREDMAFLTCYPLKLVATSLRERFYEDKEDKEDPEIEETLRLAYQNPVESKNNLIRICNAIIFKLRSKSIHFEYIKNTEGQT